MDQRKDLLELNYIIGLANQNNSASSGGQSQLNSGQLGNSGGHHGNGLQDGGLNNNGLFAFNPETAKRVINDYLADMITITNPTTIILLVLYIPMFLFSLVGNTLVIYLFFRNQHMRRLKSLFLVNLALADEAVTVVCVPLLVGQTVFRLWVYGEFMCKVTEYVQEMTVASSIFTMTALSVDHCLTVRRPRRDKRLYGRRQTAFLLIAIWILSALFVSPILTIRQVSRVEFEPLNVTMGYCIEEWPSHATRQAYSVYLFVITYVIPMGVIAGSYALVGRTLCSSRSMSGQSHKRNRRSITMKGLTSSTGAACGGQGACPQTSPALFQCNNLSPAMMMSGSPKNNFKSHQQISGSPKADPSTPVLLSPAMRESKVSRDQKEVLSRRLSPRGVKSALPLASSHAVLSGRKAIVRLLVIIVAVFAISWLPYNVISLTVDVNQDANQVRFLPFALWLGHAHSAVNPVIYWFFNRTFRHCASNVLICSILRRARRDSRSSQYV